MEHTRIDYLDTAKAYLVFLVILGHVLIVLNPGYDKLLFVAMQAFIYAFHMPAFFIIHGILFDREKWKRESLKSFLRKRAYSLLIPYLFFETLGLFWRAAFFKQSILDGIYYLVTVRCNVGADWFLPAMFLGSILLIVYVKHPQRWYGVLSTAVCFCLPMFLPQNQFAIVLGRGMLAYGFMMIGIAGKKFLCSEKTVSAASLLISLAGTAAIAILGLKYGGNDFYTCTVNDPLRLILGGISGTLFVLGISRILQCKMITDIGNHSTLTVMGTHQLAIYAMTALMPSLYNGGIAEGVILLAAIFIFEIPVVYCIEKFLPFFVGKKQKKLA